MLSAIIWWSTFSLDALTVLATAVALGIYAVTLRRLRLASTVTAPAAVLHQWLRVNALFTVMVLFNSLRWFVLHDLYPTIGREAGTGILDDLTWAICDLLLVLLPVILTVKLAGVCTVIIKEQNRG